MESSQIREYSMRFGMQPSHKNMTERSHPTSTPSCSVSSSAFLHQQRRPPLACTGGVALCLLVRDGTPCSFVPASRASGRASVHDDGDAIHSEQASYKIEQEM